MDDILDLVGELKLDTPEDIARAEAEIAKMERACAELQELIDEARKVIGSTAA